MDNEMLVRAKNGDADAFEKIILHYEKLIYNIAYRYLSNPEDARDMAQEALLKIFRNIEKCNDMAHFKAWACAITANTCIDELRRRKNIVFSNIDEEYTAASEEPGPEERYLHKEIYDRVLSEMDKLPEEYKTMIILRDMNGLSYEELAEATGNKLGTVKSKLSRARSALRERMKN